MAGQKSRFWSDPEALRVFRRYLLAKANARSALFALLAYGLRLDVLPAFLRDDEPPADLETLSRDLAPPLALGVLQKLERSFPKDAVQRDTDSTSTARWHRLVRYQAEEAAKLAGQALAEANDLLVETRARHPRDALAGIVVRVCAELGRRKLILPSRRGHRSTWLGRSYDLRLFIDVEAWLTHFRRALPGHGWSRNARTREATIAKIPEAEGLPDDLLAEVAASESREEAAYTMTARCVGLSPDRVREIVRRVRPLVRRLERADRQRASRRLAR